MGDRPAQPPDTRSGLWLQRFFDNLWILLVIGMVVPLLLYLAWGLWELIELPRWGRP